jgi:prepilin-type N-terminal cleavage/methylation domain-containing protein
MNRSARPRSAFTLFEVLVALAVFVLAALGIAQAIAGAIDAAMAARDRAIIREVLESRLAYCQAIPPPPDQPRKPEDGPPGFVIEEKLEPVAATNADGQALDRLFRLTITAARKDQAQAKESVSVLVFNPGGQPVTTQ